MQALLASEYAKRNYKQARLVLYRVLQVNNTLWSSETLLEYLTSSHELLADTFYYKCRLEV